MEVEQKELSILHLEAVLTWQASPKKYIKIASIAGQA
jgi:hypothetical protein